MDEDIRLLPFYICIPLDHAPKQEGSMYRKDLG